MRSSSRSYVCARMTTTEKYRHLYPKPLGAHLNSIDTSSINCIKWGLLPSLRNAVLNHDLVSASYMLSMSVCPGTDFLNVALQSQGGNAEMAKLLRSHNAPITTTGVLYRAQQVGGLDLAIALDNPPPSTLHYLKPMPAYYFVRDDEFCNVDPPVLRTWQPNGQPPPTRSRGAPVGRRGSRSATASRRPRRRRPGSRTAPRPARPRAS